MIPIRKVRDEQRERSLQRKLRRCRERIGEKPGKCGVPGGREMVRGGKKSTISSAVDSEVR